MSPAIIKVGKYLLLLLFIQFFSSRFGSMNLIYTTAIMSIVLVGIISKGKLRTGTLGLIIYLFLLSVIFNYITSISIFEFYVFPYFLPFFPLVVLHYYNKVGKKLPGSGAALLMLLGWLSSFIYHTLKNRGVYEYNMYGDMQFACNLIIFFSIYMLLAFNTISVWKVVIVITLSVFPELVYVFILYATTSSVSEIINERLGSSIGLSPNQVAIWLDVAFPLALFIAIYDKRPRYKWIFSFFALLYGIAILLTSSRGTLGGLLLLPAFIAFKTRSLFIKIIVVLVSLSAMGMFGRVIIKRTLTPSQSDIIGTLVRPALLKAGYFTLKDNHFFFGIGMDNFRTEKYKYNFMKLFDRKAVMSSHNSYMEIWLGWGLLGIAGWLIFIGYSIMRAIRAPLRPEFSYLKHALIFAIIASMIHGLADSTIASLPYMTFFLTIVACAYFLNESEELRQPVPGHLVSTNGLRPKPAAA